VRPKENSQEILKKIDLDNTDSIKDSYEQKDFIYLNLGKRVQQIY
jgi:hypothetical protein